MLKQTNLPNHQSVNARQPDLQIFAVQSVRAPQRMYTARSSPRLGWHFGLRRFLPGVAAAMSVMPWKRSRRRQTQTPSFKRKEKAKRVTCAQTLLTELGTDCDPIRGIPKRLRPSSMMATGKIVCASVGTAKASAVRLHMRCHLQHHLTARDDRTASIFRRSEMTCDIVECLAPPSVADSGLQFLDQIQWDESNLSGRLSRTNDSRRA